MNFPAITVLQMSLHNFNLFLGPPHDSEKAFDTGNTFYQVFKLYSGGTSIHEASKSVQTKFGSIGVGAAHRNAVISMAPFLNDRYKVSKNSNHIKILITISNFSDLQSATLSETYITHANQISYEVSLFVAVVCRQLITETRNAKFNVVCLHSWRFANKIITIT